MPKLAGIVAINRRDFAVARQRLELALRAAPEDCETGYYLQTVLSEQRDWEAAARVAAAKRAPVSSRGNQPSCRNSPSVRASLDGS